MGQFTIKLNDKQLTGSYNNKDIKALEMQLSQVFGIHSVTGAFQRNDLLTSTRFNSMIVLQALKDNHDEVRQSEIDELSPVELRNAAKPCLDELNNLLHGDVGKPETRGPTSAS